MRKINIIKRTICKWCGKTVAEQNLGKRNSVSSRDIEDDVKTIYDFHEECWNEAIEVVVEGC